MGSAGRRDLQWLAGNDRAGGRAPDAPARVVVRENVEAGGRGRGAGKGRHALKHAYPRIGDRIGELVVTGFLVGKWGGVSRVLVRCSCEGPEYGASLSNLRSGKTTRCMFCAVRKSVETRKQYVGYRQVVADDGL